MMVVVNQGEQLSADATTGKTNATAWTLRAFSLMATSHRILAATVANPTVIQTSAAHGLTTGDKVVIAMKANNDATPTIQGEFVATVTDGTHFTIPVNVTVAGVAGYFMSKRTLESDLTESTGGGYAAAALTAANWVTTNGSPTQTAYPEQVLTFTGVLTTNPDVLGYYITNAGGKLHAIEFLPVFFTPTTNGDTVKVTPVLTFGSVYGD